MRILGSNVLNHRCVKCGKLLAKEEGSAYEIKCLRCGTTNSIFTKLKDQVIVTDLTGKILYVNGMLEEITGYKLEEVLGKTPAIWGGQMPKAFYEEMWRLLLEEKNSVLAKITNRHKSGRLYNALLKISPIYDTSNKIQFFIGIESVMDKTDPTRLDWTMPRSGNDKNVKEV